MAALVQALVAMIFKPSFYCIVIGWINDCETIKLLQFYLIIRWVVKTWLWIPTLKSKSNPYPMKLPHVWLPQELSSACMLTWEYTVVCNGLKLMVCRPI